MAEIIVNGGKQLTGEIAVQGAKNSVLPVLAGAVLCDGECVIHNCPNLSDVQSSIKILRNFGAKVSYQDNTVTVDCRSIEKYEIPESLMREMRSSVVFLGGIIGRTKRAIISNPGGCELGPRPIDLHLSALKKLGVEIYEEHGFLNCNAEKGLYGTEIHLAFPSVGATENVILTAATAKGVTVIHNAAREPEISDLADFLNSAGARIYGSGSDTIYIHGVDKLHGTTHTIIPDRIVAATYMSAAAITGSKLNLSHIMPSHMVAILHTFRESGCDISVKGKALTITAPKRLSRVPTIRSLVYPGFPTDAGPLLISMLAMAKGTTVFVENIFENRFRYINELNRLGANIKTEGKVAVIEGVNSLSGAKCVCPDLRGGAALVVAALSANGQSEIDNISHINRGYDDITGVLASVGADIKTKE
ncbi:MAG: UDP-N-acetylglucosamine 1-carboxyvinyltransferase [Clostridia bacterium]|nr:UDP-N-acetylglucosamine 1-carboxyvinyltransferase [Clostridia bacterium]